MNFEDELHIMVDLETLGLKSNTVISAIGARHWNLKTGELFKSFYKRVNVESFSEQHSIDASTVLFWLNQDKEVIKETFFGETVHIYTALLEFRNFVNTIIDENPDKKIYFWANSPDFDLDKLEFNFKFYKLEFPIINRKTKVDLRTWLLLSNKEDNFNDLTLELLKSTYPDNSYHNAQFDCDYQSTKASLMYQKYYKR